MKTENTTEKQNALAKHLGCDPESLILENHDHYGLEVYSSGSREYAIGTDDEATDAAISSIEQSVWAFNASFILGECGLPLELEDCIKAFQEEKCESANDALLALVEKCCVSQSLKTGLCAFADSAISTDGRGHFMSSYDGEESEVTIEAPEESKDEHQTFYIYRIN